MGGDYFWLLFLIIVLAVGWVGYVVGRARTEAARFQGQRFHSTPDYYGWYTVILAYAPAVALTLIAAGLEFADLYTIRTKLLLAAWLIAPAVLIWPIARTIHPGRRARHFVERTIYSVLFAASMVSILVTVGIVLSVLFEALRFFQEVSAWDFLTGTTWAPGQSFKASAGREKDAEAYFGAVPLFAGTFMISGIAMLVAVPVGIFSAVYMSEYASTRVRRVAKPMLEILAGIPTVVYGFFAAITVAPVIVKTAAAVGVDAAGTSALAPGLIMGVMIIPFMSSISDDVISAVPQSLRAGALALGATQSETIKRVVLPAALPGIVSAFLLSISRALGETMIVVMAAGQLANLSINPLEPMTTVTVQIVALLTGDLEFDSPHTLSAFALALTLLVMTLGLNVVSLVVIRKFRQRYE